MENETVNVDLKITTAENYKDADREASRILELNLTVVGFNIKIKEINTVKEISKVYISFYNEIEFECVVFNIDKILSIDKKLPHSLKRIFKSQYIVKIGYFIINSKKILKFFHNIKLTAYIDLQIVAKSVEIYTISMFDLRLKFEVGKSEIVKFIGIKEEDIRLMQYMILDAYYSLIIYKNFSKYFSFNGKNSLIKPDNDDITKFFKWLKNRTVVKNICTFDNLLDNVLNYFQPWEDLSKIQVNEKLHLYIEELVVRKKLFKTTNGLIYKILCNHKEIQIPWRDLFRVIKSLKVETEGTSYEDLFKQILSEFWIKEDSEIQENNAHHCLRKSIELNIFKIKNNILYNLIDKKKVQKIVHTKCRKTKILGIIASFPYDTELSSNMTFEALCTCEFRHRNVLPTELAEIIYAYPVSMLDITQA